MKGNNEQAEPEGIPDIVYSETNKTKPKEHQEGPTEAHATSLVTSSIHGRKADQRQLTIMNTKGK
ncbi:MAG: hypothetical protein ACOYJF_08355 [Prevotella sp.]|jgi:hypothetical protein